MKSVFFIIWAFLGAWSPALYAGEEVIPLDSIRLPSDDLIFQGELLNPERAWQMSKDPMNPLDLSQLTPVPSEVWGPNTRGPLDPTLDEMALSKDQTVQFQGIIGSNIGVLRFNALSLDGEANRVYTILLEKTLHVTLLRKNLLRKLGFKIPAMKFIPHLRVQFTSIEERDLFISRQIPDGTYGAPSRWIPEEQTKPEYKELVVDLYDVIAFEPKETDHYNTAMGVPPRRLTSRTLRSVLLPYALLDIGESLNKTSWIVGMKDNKTVRLPHFTEADFSTTLDDALWMSRRMRELTREDFEEIVNESYFPSPVNKLVLEKIISRRNALLKIFEPKVGEISFNAEVSDGKILKKGRLIQEEWPGYSARFAHGLPDSPFRDTHLYLLSKLQASSIDGLIQTANEKLSAFDIGKARSKFHQDQFKEGLDHFVETGEFIEFPIGTWFSPVLDGSIITQRDIVIGNTMGTDNMVQLADTFGLAITVGGHLGIENFAYGAHASVRAGLNLLKTYSHLKPVKSLKETFKQPYKNIIVPLLKNSLKKKLYNIAASESDLSAMAEKEKKEQLEKMMAEVNKNLGVGESLIITTKITPSVLVSGGGSFMETSFTLGASTELVTINRLHLYRKDAKTIQVYDDRGDGREFKVFAGVNYYIPVLKLESSQTNGKYKVKLFDLNIDNDLEANPNFFSNANALYEVLTGGSTELLEYKTKPFVVENDYKDTSTRYAFLVWRAKYLKGNSLYSITDKKGNKTDYVSIESDDQSGINYLSFLKDVTNYYLQKYLAPEGINISLDPERFKNPGQSTFGVAETRSARYEARLFGEDESLNKKEVRDPFISLTYKKEGWSASEKKLKKMMEEINEKYEAKLFDTNTVNDIKSLKLFDVRVNIYLYDSAVEQLENLDDSIIDDMAKKYKAARAFSPECDRRHNRMMKPEQMMRCGYLDNLKSLNQTCKKEKTRSVSEHGRCLLKLSSQMEKWFEFKDFIKVIGEKNYYLFGTVDGFRTKSEILNDTIESHTLGEISGRYWNGPLETLKKYLGIQSGEFEGRWIRESL